jgi:ABC-type nitrate/sulfonate/bicarbonate transport system substrate-binding protein
MTADEMQRREYLKYTGIGLGASTAGLAGCLGDGEGDNGGGGDDDGTVEQNLEEMSMLWTEGSMSIPVALAGSAEDSWVQEGIDLDTTVAGYGRYSQALQGGEAVINNVNSAIYMNAHRDDYDMRLAGATETQVNGAFVPEDSDIEGPEDFEDAVIGIPPRSSGTSAIMLSLIQDEFGYDIDEIAEDVVETGPATLWNLMTEQGDLDVMFQFTGFTIQARAEDSPVREVFDPDEYWRGQTGSPAIISFWGADPDWIGANPSMAVSFLRGWQNARDFTLENTADVVDQYGRLAGFTSEAELAEFESTLEGGALLDPEDWDEDLAESQFDILQKMVDNGFYDEVPDFDEHVETFDELSERA